MIVDDVVLVLPYDVHCVEHVQSVVDTPLHVLEVNLLAYLSTYNLSAIQQSLPLTSQKLLYISSISLAIYVPVTMGRSLTF